MVEAQHRVSTLRLVDDLAEQEVLEELLDRRAKPPAPSGAEFDGLHYLLATPFRYPPLRHGSRFGARTERSIWYGAEEIRTALAEVAYYRLLFLAGSTAPIAHVASEHSAFRASVATARGLDLLAPPFARHRALLSSPVGYGAGQALGTVMRSAGIEAFRYASARDREGGVAMGVLSPRAFASKRPTPRALPTWHCSTTPQRVVFRRRDSLREESFAFPRENFLVAGRLPAPAA